MRLPRKTTSEPSKVVRACGVFNILTWKCALRHNRVHVFIISTYKSAQSMVCFVHFNFDMCFAPQGRALFQHLNFQKCTERAVLLAFWLGHVLRATTACNFSSLIRPDGSAPVALASLYLPTFSRACIVFFLTISLLWSSLFFSSLLFSSLLKLLPPLLSICPYCRKFGF